MVYKKIAYFALFLVCLEQVVVSLCILYYLNGFIFLIFNSIHTYYWLIRFGVRNLHNVFIRNLLQIEDISDLRNRNSRFCFEFLRDAEENFLHNALFA
jgi:TM2 domain-containing membrane protein YozV